MAEKLNSTLRKFGYPDTLIKEYENWYLLLRPDQVTLASLILITKNSELKFSDIPPSSFRELGEITKQVESSLHRLFAFDKINYLMLMMVDPEVHYHIIPRYGKDVLFESFSFKDHGWPGLPNFSLNNIISEDKFSTLAKTLSTEFRRDE